MRLPAAACKENPKTLLKLVLAQWQGSSACIGSSLGLHCPPPEVAAAPTPDSSAAVAHVLKAVPEHDSDDFRYLVAVSGGALGQGDKLFVHRAGGHSTAVEVKEIALCHARFVTVVSRAPAGNIVLLKLAGDVVLESRQLLSTSDSSPRHADGETAGDGAVAVVKVSVEPVKPSELPKLVAGLRRM